MTCRTIMTCDVCNKESKKDAHSYVNIYMPNAEQHSFDVCATCMPKVLDLFKVKTTP